MDAVDKSPLLKGQKSPSKRPLPTITTPTAFDKPEFKRHKGKDDTYKVAVVGQIGSYAHVAAQKFWDGNTNAYVHCRNFRGVFKAVSESRVDVGVVPIENTTMGYIHQIYDLLLQHSNLYIIGETTQHESHDLCAAADVPLNTIKRIISHPVALQQCSTFLMKHDEKVGEQVQQVEAGDTASACAELAKSGRKDTGVIANSEVAKMHSLQVLQQGISDDVNNTTRFIIIASHPIKVDVQPHLSKTTIAFALQDEPGSLYKALSVFALRNINIRKVFACAYVCTYKDVCRVGLT